MRRCVFIKMFLAVTSAFCTRPADAVIPPISSYAEAVALSDEDFAEDRPFEIECHVIAAYPNGTVFVRDLSGYFEILFESPHDLQPGHTAIVSGHTLYKTDSSQVRDLVACKAVKTGFRNLPNPEATSISAREKDLDRIEFCTIKGKITDVFVDEIDPGWNYLILKDGVNMMHIAVPDEGDFRKRMTKLVDAEVELTGAAFSGHAGFRIFIGPFMRIWGESCIRILKSAPEDPFSLPRLKDLRDTRPEKIAAMERRTAKGTVIAAWGADNILMREDSGVVIRVKLSESTDMPRYGERITAVGYPETDLYRINLARARFRRDPSEGRPVEKPEEISPGKILQDASGRKMIKPNYLGRLLTLKGFIRALPNGGTDEKLIHIDSDGFLVPVDITMDPHVADDLEIGCKVQITGICVFETQNWSPNMIFPRIDRFILVPRSDLDITVLARPPWWTPTKLLALIGGLLAAMAGILFWNRSLRRIAERRGRELYRAEISKATAELKIDERMRLAADLHDSLAQNLTGVSLHIAAAKSARSVAPDEELEHMETAERMLMSSRTELRRCIWDLRSEALDESDFAKAIQLTIHPIIGKTALQVDWGIPRSRLSDMATHGILCMIRELIANAVTHGKAGTIRVTGNFDANTITFSVEDDGCGFDPGFRPGEIEGHFGLRGIQERAKRLGGVFTINSRISEGRCATVTIRKSL